ncbi:restriction endonuclease [Curtobacterium sp. SP.BCo]|uniref:restriction endonuclease n=1 Tax=Curtobacterium sp. SP.BCo TaxID=3435229 RepID=UPI003F740DA7
MNTAPKRRLIAANEFTPRQLGGAADALNFLLNTIADRGLSQQDLSEVIRDRWFASSAQNRTDPMKRRLQQLKRAANVVTGMRQYSIISPGRDLIVLTPMGARLRSMLSDGRERDAADLLASHLLRKADGVDVLRAAESVRRREGAVRGQEVASELRLRGFDIPNNNAAASKMRQWLEWANVVDRDWKLDNPRLRALVGYGLDEVSDWYSLTWTQRAYLEVLRDASSVVAGAWVPARQALAVLDERAVRFDRAQARKSIYEPLARSGWLELSASGDGRHSKGGDVRLAAKGLTFDFEAVGLLAPDPLPSGLQEALSQPLDVVLADLNSQDTGRKGLALEVLAARIALDLGLIPRQLRVRGGETGGAEVDLLAEQAGFSFERWTVQCKNQRAAVPVSVVAKEAGVAAVLRSNVVLIVTTSSFTQSARAFAKSVNEISATQIMLLDGGAVADYAKRGSVAIQEHVHLLAQEVGRQKAFQGALVSEVE